MDNNVIRNAIRQTFMNIFSNFNQHLLTDPLPEDEVKLSIDLLGEKFHQLEQLNKVILENMVNSKVEECDIVKEMHIIDDYKMKYLRAKLEARKKLSKSFIYAKTPVTGSSQYLFDSPFEESMKRNSNFWLPKIEIKKFNGNIKDWLQFWSQFKKIHEDSSITKEDKFQYLIHAMDKDSKACELVRSYPCTSENYDKAITALITRFGRDELLIEVYVRSILELVLRNSSKGGKRMTLSKTYDRLQIYINALESLGAITDKCAIIICTLVESSLSRQMLRNWKKHHLSDNMNVPEKRLWKLMEFLRTEVDHEEKIYFIDQKTVNDEDTLEKSERSKKKKKKKKKANSSDGFGSFLVSSARKLFRVLMRRIG